MLLYWPLITASWILLLLTAFPAFADSPLRVAVASNVADAAEAIVERFEAETGHAVTLSTGSTGKQYAQIRHGAPFEVFLAADRRRPRLLAEAGKAVEDSRTTYARGRLVLWSPGESLVDPEGEVLATDDYAYLALANPRLAPYGRAAKQVLEERNLWEALDGRRVMGENIAQTFQFVRTGSAPLGFVARAQLEAPGRSVGGSRWLVPKALHDPIEQQAVLLADEPEARAFLDYVTGEQGRAILRDHGYEVP
ncbi:MAG: molybdate ABC transporter substrate-binding protein [Pseudomonadota bacterium]